jgi:hypothetical protein
MPPIHRSGITVSFYFRKPVVYQCSLLQTRHSSRCQTVFRVAIVSI